MDRSILLIALLAIICAYSMADVPGWDIESISRDSIGYWDLFSSSGQNVAWIGCNDILTGDIFFYEGSTAQTFQITHYEDYFGCVPLVSGTNIVWLAERQNDEIFFYSHQTQTITRLTDNDYDDSPPRISGTTAVWTCFDGQDLEIFVYDGNDVTQLTDNDYDDYEPDVSGTNITWYADPNGDDFEIFLYDGIETIQLTDNEHDDKLPRISGQNISWQGDDGSDYEIFLYNHDTQITTQLTLNETYDGSPQISGSNVFWGKSFYDGDSVTEIPFTYSMYRPRLSGSKVVWFSFEIAPDNKEIYVYDHDMMTVTQLTDNTFNDECPLISNDVVVWVGWNDPPYPSPSSIDIMMATYTGCVEPLEADTNDDCKIDMTDLDNMAGNWLTELNLPGFESTQLTDNSSSDGTPKISENNIVWSGPWSGSGNVIYYYNGDTEIVSLLGSGYGPVISGSNVAWVHTDSDWPTEGDIFFYDGKTVTQLTDNDYNDAFYDSNRHSISIDGTQIAWAAEPNDEDWEIFLYDGDNIRQITNNEYDDNWPQISGSLITWQRFDGNDDEICVYDGQTIRQLTNNDYYDYYPQVSGSIIVWGEYDGNDSEIFLYNHDANSIIQLTDNDQNDRWPLVGGSNVAWTGYDGNDYEIFYYDGSTIKQITDNDIDDGYSAYCPVLSISESGQKVVWMNHTVYSIPETEIFLYDAELDLTVQLTDNDYFDTLPDISGNNIAWYGYPDEVTSQGSEIFTAEYYPCFTPPAGDANGDCKINLTDFAILASEWMMCGMDDPDKCW